ncbi:hypothetical protein D3C71_298710 [compost metagenome]
MSTVIVTAAPAIFTVAPNGIDTLAVDGLTPKRSAKSKLTGMLAAELRVKKAVIPLSLRHLNTRGYGFPRIVSATRIGLITKATKNIVPNSTTNNCA